MAIEVLINSVDLTDQIDRPGFEVAQILGTLRDTARFTYKKFGARTYVPEAFDEVVISDGGVKIFGGRVVNISEKLIANSDGVEYQIECADWGIDLDAILVAESYVNETIDDIIADLLTNVTGFTSTAVDSTYVISKIVFNQVPISQAIKRLADIVRFDWYVDPDKDVHFFSKYANTAPFNLTDTSGNYVNKSLARKLDGTQIANQVKVRGGFYNAALYTDIITVKGNETKTFILPYQFNSLTVKLNGVTQNVGIDNINDFTTDDVLYSYNDYMIRFENSLVDGDEVEYSGLPRVRVLAIASDSISIATYGIREKLIEDTSIEDVSIARTRAIAELAAFKDEQNNATFETYTSGLRAGMLINLTSALRDADVDFLIRTVKFIPRTPTTFVYKVELVSTRLYDLTEILQKLLQPDSIALEEAEVAEDIKTDLATLTIVESITVGTAIDTIAETVAIVEVIDKDPIGAGVAPIWVLAPHVPSSTADPNREGLLTNSLIVY